MYKNGSRGVQGGCASEREGLEKISVGPSGAGDTRQKIHGCQKAGAIFLLGMYLVYSTIISAYSGNKRAGSFMAA